MAEKAKRFYMLVGVVLVVVLLSQVALAQDDAAESAEPAVKPGVIASTGNYQGQVDINASEGSGADGLNMDEENVSPVSASVRRDRGDRCTITFRNSGDATYSLRGNVVVTRGGRESKRYFNASVPAGKETTRTVSGCYSDAEGVRVVLTKATKR